LQKQTAKQNLHSNLVTQAKIGIQKTFAAIFLQKEKCFLYKNKKSYKTKKYFSAKKLFEIKTVRSSLEIILRPKFHFGFIFRALYVDKKVFSTPSDKSKNQYVLQRISLICSFKFFSKKVSLIFAKLSTSKFVFVRLCYPRFVTK